MYKQAVKPTDQKIVYCKLIDANILPNCKQVRIIGFT